MLKSFQKVTAPKSKTSQLCMASMARWNCPSGFWWQLWTARPQNPGLAGPSPSSNHWEQYFTPQALVAQPSDIGNRGLCFLESKFLQDLTHHFCRRELHWLRKIVSGWWWVIFGRSVQNLLVSLAGRLSLLGWTLYLRQAILVWCLMAMTSQSICKKTSFQNETR